MAEIIRCRYKIDHNLYSFSTGFLGFLFITFDLSSHFPDLQIVLFFLFPCKKRRKMK